MLEIDGTLIVAMISFVIFMFIMNIVISIIQTLKMTSVVKINIEDKLHND